MVRSALPSSLALLTSRNDGPDALTPYGVPASLLGKYYHRIYRSEKMMFLRFVLMCSHLSIFGFQAASEPLVELVVDADSWLSFAFPMGVRLCPTSRCQSTVYGYSNSSPEASATVYLTSFGGRVSPINVPSRRTLSGESKSLALSAVVFMENDARFERNLSQRLSSAGWWQNLDLALGYASDPPAPIRFGSMNIGPREWKQLSYIDDSFQSFSNPPPLPWAKQLKAVAYFSSQCSPEFAAPRLAIASELATHLGESLHSYGNCIHNRELTQELPQCADLPIHNVDHDGPKHCALSHYPFYLALENSESSGYATEKLWQGLLAGSVPVYWGAPDILSLIPHKDAVIDVRSFETIEALSVYLKDALLDPLGEVFERHTAWKRMYPSEWNEGFRSLSSRHKSGVFCEVCEWASALASRVQQPDVINPEATKSSSILYPLPPLICDVLAKCGDRLGQDVNCSFAVSAFDVADENLKLNESLIFEVLNSTANKILPSEVETLPNLISALSYLLLSPDHGLHAGALRVACAMELKCPPYKKRHGSEGHCDILSLSACVRASWLVIERRLALGGCDSHESLQPSESMTPSSLKDVSTQSTPDEYHVFHSSDSRWPRRLPCSFRGVLRFDISSLTAVGSISSSTVDVGKKSSSLALDIPLSDALNVIYSFDKLHHYFLEDIKGVCHTVMPSSHIEKEDGRCVGNLFVLLDNEIARHCPDWALSEPSTEILINRSNDVTNFEEQISWSKLRDVHLVSAADPDLQRFWHIFLGELLPVASVALRMTENTINTPNSVSKKLFLYSSAGNWGQNPLHRLYRDLSTMGNGTFEIIPMNGPGPDPKAKKEKGSLGPVSLPRWDFGWYGFDKVRALGAGRYVEYLARKFFALSPRHSPDSADERKCESVENDVVFQLRTEDDPALVAFYRKLHEDLEKRGISDFGKQNYSL